MISEIRQVWMNLNGIRLETNFNVEMIGQSNKIRSDRVAERIGAVDNKYFVHLHGEFPASTNVVYSRYCTGRRG